MQQLHQKTTANLTTHLLNEPLKDLCWNCNYSLSLHHKQFILGPDKHLSESSHPLFLIAEDCERATRFLLLSDWARGSLRDFSSTRKIGDVEGWMPVTWINMKTIRNGPTCLVQLTVTSEQCDPMCTWDYWLSGNMFVIICSGLNKQTNGDTVLTDLE